MSFFARTTLIAVVLAMFAVSADAGMSVALKCDLSHVRGLLDGDDSDSTLIDIPMVDGLAVWKGNLDSALTAGGTMVGFATHERIAKLVGAGIAFKLQKTGPGISFSNTRGLYFVILGWENGEQIAAAVPVRFSPFGVGMGPPENRWHNGGWFRLSSSDEDWVPWSNGG